ncbi:peptidoglycan-binding protein [Evansella cellulosilytica]|uniref:Peptidase S8 and S53 subtilisin kexin sedolisin n=1 Tax=Evansella cellulosilytica (strain ATCC 21833 / DSM 2522 / FERM P-1141 / JCM 9156 / N-4) TaxID=649639 RepID=E6TR46_EVAC2|nr:peptidoglycan-binding protein [Evansella cellulosilytica]ADU29422.1 peptidase S8 and S53 subtilisin kexin sedolisin [Evansella cellulosilytica DSM 2522]
MQAKKAIIMFLSFVLFFHLITPFSVVVATQGSLLELEEDLITSTSENNRLIESDSINNIFSSKEIGIKENKEIESTKNNNDDVKEDSELEVRNHQDQVSYESPDSDEDKVIVLFKNQANKDLITNAKGTIHHEFKNIPALAISIPHQAIEGLKNNPNVISVEENKSHVFQRQTVDWGIERVQAPLAWENGFTGKGVKVAIIDTGIDTTHSDLDIAGCFSATNAPTCEDSDGHGTHVAGIIGARDNDVGVVGIAPEASIYAARVSNLEGEIWSADIIAAVDWAISEGVDIINMSLGSSEYSSILDHALTKANNEGILLVAAAGNDNKSPVNYPAALPHVIAVSATDKNDKLASFSNIGNEIEVSAPGTSIPSTFINNSYATMSGTSMAAPHVSGVLALMIEANPDLDHVELRKLMHANSMDIGPEGKDHYFGYGLVQFTIEDEETTDVLPAEPTNLQVSKVGSKNINLSWDTVNNADTYLVSVTDFAEFEVDVPEIQLDFLLPNTTYEIKVAAINSYGSSKKASIEVMTLIASTEVHSKNITSNSIELYWSKNSDATYYELYRDNVLIYMGTETQFKDIDLKPDTNYHYYLIAKNTVNKSEPSTQITVKTSNKTSLDTEELIQFQEDLMRLGFLNNSDVNGEFNIETEVAIRDFQEYYGLVATGMITTDTKVKIQEILSSPLRNGQHHDSAIQLKINLSFLDFHVSNNPTTYYGPTTERKVREFQEKYGLRVNGIADEITLKKIESLINSPMALGTYRKDVITLKNNLAILGFHISNNPTTYYGPTTERVVREFQDYYGLEVTGIASQETLEKIEEILSSPLRNGQHDEGAIQLKINLSLLGFHISNNPTTHYGPTTERKVREFQQVNGLKVNGIADKVTLKTIQELLSTTMALGTHSQEVVTLKNNLATLGFHISNNPTTYYGPITEQVVREFQRYYGLKMTGVASQETLNKIESVLSSPLRNGQHHESAIQLKINLSLLGFHVSNNPTTYYGPMTERRVREFQSAHGLIVNGIADEITLAKIAELL